MALAIYKPGQGYWTRVMTAVLAGVLVLAAAGWLYQQALLIPLPERAWVAAVDRPAELAPGQQVELLGEVALAQPPVLGSAVVESVDASAGGGTVSIIDASLVEGATRSQVQALRVPGGATVAIAGGGLRGVPIVPRIYVQGGLVVLTVLIGAGVIVYYVAINRRSVDFLIAVDGEMRKVNWSTRKDIINSTWVVIGASVIIGAYLFAFDTIFALFFRAIGVLDI